MQTPIHMSVNDVCARHNLSRSYLYRLIGAGKIIARKNGYRTLIDVASVDAYFTALPAAKIKPDSRGVSECGTAA
jgi:excisionase family DNA binding protein